MASNSNKYVDKSENVQFEISDDEYDEEDQIEEFTIEKIVNKRKHNGKVEYFLKWKDYTYNDNTWVSEECIGCRDMINEYELNLTQQNIIKEKPDVSSKRILANSSVVSDVLVAGPSKENKLPSQNTDLIKNLVKSKKKDITKKPELVDDMEMHDKKDDDEEEKKKIKQEKMDNKRKEKKKIIQEKMDIKRKEKKKIIQEKMVIKRKEKKEIKQKKMDIKKEKKDECKDSAGKEKLPEKIIGATKCNGQLLLLMKWQGIAEEELIPACIANEKYPEIVISFYQPRLLWNKSLTV